MNLTTRHALKHAIVILGLFGASSTFAGSEIVKCVDADGKVTLTDAACPTSAQVVALVAGASDSDNGNNAATGDMGDSATAPAAAPAVDRYYPAYVPQRRQLPVVKHQASGSLARDVATLQVARSNLRLLDNAAQLLRNQRIASNH